ncbi:glucose-1-phosphate adenylyltransferase large subunit, chloroplastic/amyloplastic-like protein [Tanacetum coccineum]
MSSQISSSLSEKDHEFESQMLEGKLVFVDDDEKVLKPKIVPELGNDVGADKSIDGVELLVLEVNGRFSNSNYEFFQGKRVAYSVFVNYVKNTLSKYGLVKTMSKGLFFFMFRSKDGMDILENGQWSSYARTMIELRADIKLKDTIVVVCGRSIEKLTKLIYIIRVIRASNQGRPLGLASRATTQGIKRAMASNFRDNNRGSRAAALFDNLEEGGSRDIIDDDYENDNSDVFSYPEDESVTDPFLADHLAFFGIDFSSLQKQVDTTVLGLSDHEALKNPYIASMGVYVFRTEVLLELLKWKYPSCNDFGSEIIPSAVAEHNVQPPRFDFNDPKTPFFTSPRFLPPTKVEKCRIVDAIISHGCFLRDCSVEHSVVGIRSRLNEGVELKVTFFPSQDIRHSYSFNIIKSHILPMSGYHDDWNCIIDKNAKIGKNVVIANKNNVEEADRSDEGFYIRSAAK